LPQERWGEVATFVHRNGGAASIGMAILDVRAALCPQTQLPGVVRRPRGAWQSLHEGWPVVRQGTPPANGRRESRARNPQATPFAGRVRRRPYNSSSLHYPPFQNLRKHAETYE